MLTLDLALDAADLSLDAARRRLAEPVRRERLGHVLAAAALAAASAVALAVAVILGPPGLDHPADPGAEASTMGQGRAAAAAPTHPGAPRAQAPPRR